MSKKMNVADVHDNKLWGYVIRYIIPLVLTGILHLLFNAADIVVVGRFASNGELAVGAVGSTTALINMLVNAFLGLSVGTSTCVARRFGAKDEDGVAKAVHTSVLISFISGIAVMVIGLFGSRLFLEAMDTPQTLIDQATLYMRIYFIGVPALLTYNFCAAAMRAVGNTKTPFVVLTAAGVINVILNLIFVIGFKLDVAGVAIATTVSHFFACFAIMFSFIKADDFMKIRMKEMKIDAKTLGEIVRIGIPAGLQSVCYSISNVIVQSAINGFGDIAVSGNTSASNIEGFIYTAINTLYHACLTFTGQVVGAGQIKRTTKVLVRCVIIVTLIGVIGGGLMGLVFGKQLLEIYLPESPEAVSYGLVRLSVVCVTYFLCGITDTMAGSIRGMGTSISTMLTCLLGAAGFRILWIHTFFKLDPTLMNLYILYPVSWIITGLAYVAIYIVDHKRLLKGKAPLP